MDKSTKLNLLDDKQYEAALAAARARREQRHEKVRANTKNAVRTTHVWVVAHS